MAAWTLLAVLCGSRGSGCRYEQGLQALMPHLQERSHQMAADALRSSDREGALPGPDLRSLPAVHSRELCCQGQRLCCPRDFLASHPTRPQRAAACCSRRAHTDWLGLQLGSPTSNQPLRRTSVGEPWAAKRGWIFLPRRVRTYPPACPSYISPQASPIRLPTMAHGRPGPAGYNAHVGHHS